MSQPNTKEEVYLFNIEKTMAKGYAPKGFVMITGSAAQSVSAGTYFAVHFVTECTLTTFTATNCTTVTVVHAAGSTVYADILTITASSGNTYMLYKN